MKKPFSDINLEWRGALRNDDSIVDWTEASARYLAWNEGSYDSVAQVDEEGASCHETE